MHRTSVPMVIFSFKQGPLANDLVVELIEIQPNLLDIILDSEM